MTRTGLGEPLAPGASEAAEGEALLGAGDRPARFVDVVRSEWTKLRTLRSTYIAVGAAAILIVGLAALIAFGVGSHGGHDRPPTDPSAVSFFSLTFGQLAVSVLAIMTITSEYATGMVRTTFQAMPRRTWVLAAKALVVTAVILVVGEICAFAAFFVGQSLLHSYGTGYATLGDPGVLRAVIGAGLYLPTIALLALAIGALVRHTAGAITVMVAVYFVVPIVANALPLSWQRPVQEYLPTGAGQQVYAAHQQAFMLAPWAGFGVLWIYVAVLGAAAVVLLRRRDA